jgi:hypothetical protein
VKVSVRATERGQLLRPKCRPIYSTDAAWDGQARVQRTRDRPLSSDVLAVSVNHAGDERPGQVFSGEVCVQEKGP